MKKSWSESSQEKEVLHARSSFTPNGKMQLLQKFLWVHLFIIFSGKVPTFIDVKHTIVGKYWNKNRQQIVRNKSFLTHYLSHVFGEEAWFRTTGNSARVSREIEVQTALLHAMWNCVMPSPTSPTGRETSMFLRWTFVIFHPRIQTEISQRYKFRVH